MHVSLPTDVESPPAKIIYPHVAGEATAAEICETLWISKRSALGVLDSL